MTKYSLLALIVFVIGCFISIFIPLFFVRNNTPDALKTRLEMIPMYLGPVMAFVSALLFVDSLVQQHRSYTLQSYFETEACRNEIEINVYKYVHLFTENNRETFAHWMSYITEQKYPAANAFLFNHCKSAMVFPNKEKS